MIVSYSVFAESWQTPMGIILTVVFSVAMHALMKAGHKMRIEEYEKQEAAKKMEYDGDE